MKKLQILLVLIPVLVINSCKEDSWCNCLENTGGEGVEIRETGSFNTINMDNNVDIILTPGSETKVKVTCGKNLIDGVKTEVRDSVLYISNVNKCNWLRDFKNKFTVEVTYTELEYITTTGSGELSCSDTLKTDFLFAEGWNATGVLNLILDTKEVYLKLHTGPADIIASGNTETMYVYTAGNGFVKAAAVQSNYTYVTSKSTGDVEVNATIDLEATIEYQGDVYYKGSPSTIQTAITGSGKLIPF